MKRLLTIGLMLASAFALTNCAEEIAAPVQDDVTVDGNIENTTPPAEEVDIPFEVFANLGGEAETKTYAWGNGTYWYKNKGEGDTTPSDQISVFHHDGTKFTHNKAFTIFDDATGLFRGSLSNQLGDKNDWYFLYPYNKDYTISSGSATTITNVTVGAQVVEDVEPGSKKHIFGEAYPMYGSIKGLNRDTSPDIEMHHVAALVAIKIVNKTSDLIKIEDVEFGMPKIVSKDPLSGTKTTIEATNIIGDCKVSLNGESITTTVDGTDVYPTTKTYLKETYDLKSGGEMIVYMAVSPIKTTGKTISIKVNGSQRTQTMEEDVLNPGKVTTFKVQIMPFEKNATEGLTSNAFDKAFKSQGEIGYNWIETQHEEKSGYIPDYYYTYAKGDMDNTHTQVDMVLLPEAEELNNIKINGQLCEKAYVVGTSEAAGTIKISGWAKDIIDALPLSFYASGLDNSPAAMTIQSVNLWIPEYNIYKERHNKYLSPNTITEYHNLKTRKALKDSNLGYLISLGGVVMEGLEVTDVGFERECLVNFVDPNTITFNGIPTNGYFDNNNVVVLKEADTHKSITPDLINSFFSKKFKANYKGTEYIPSYLGLVAILNAEKNIATGALTYKAYDSEHDDIVMKNLANETASAIYYKILGVLEAKLGSFYIPLVGQWPDILLNVAFESPHDVIHKLRDMKFEIVLQTYPYAEEYTKTEPDAPYAPIVFWEMNGTSIR